MKTQTKPKNTSTTKTFTISLSSDRYKQLEDMAKKNERSKNYFIKKALDNYLEDIYFSEKAEKIIEKGLGKTYTLAEIKKKYGL